MLQANSLETSRQRFYAAPIASMVVSLHKNHSVELHTVFPGVLNGDVFAGVGYAHARVFIQLRGDNQVAVPFYVGQCTSIVRVYILEYYDYFPLYLILGFFLHVPEPGDRIHRA